MLMVDKILFVNDEKVETVFLIDKNCIFVSNGKLNEVGLIENSAQTCSSIVGKDYFEEGDTEGKTNELIGFINIIKTAKIYHLPNVNDTILTRATLVSSFDFKTHTISTMNCEVVRDDVILAEFVINLMIQEVKENE